MVAPIIILEGAVSGFAIAGMVGALGYGWVRRQWAAMGILAGMSLSLAAFSAITLISNQTSDLELAVALARDAGLSAVIFLAAMPFLCRVLTNRRPAWPDYAIAGWFVIVAMVVVCRRGGVAWSTVTAVVPVDIGWLGTERVLTGVPSKLLIVCHVIRVLVLIYCVGILWPHRRQRGGGIYAIVLMPLLMIGLTIYANGLSHGWWHGPNVNEFVALSLYLCLGSVVIGQEREFMSERDRLLQSQAEGVAFRQRVFESLPVPIVVMDAVTSQYMDCNPAAVKMYGFSTREETLGKTPIDVSAPVQADGTPTPEKVRFYINQALAKGEVVFEWRHVRRNGKPWDAQVHLMSFRAGQRDMLQFTLQDISERKAAVRQIHEQAALIDASQDAILVWDVAKGIQFMNRAAEKMTGRHLAEVGLQALAAALRTKSASDLQTATKEVLSCGQWSGELSLVDRQGQAMEVASRWTLLANPQGNSQSILITVNDITEKKRLESQYLRAQRLESVGTLASGIAHDLNNILSPIMMGVDMLEMTAADADAKETLAMMRDSARRGVDTVKQLLTFARGKETQRGPVQPRHLLKEVVRLLQQTFPKNIQIYSDYNGSSATVLADPSQLHQVMMNLCVNARDAMPEGGTLFLSLKARTLDEAEARVHPKARARAYVVIEVCDSGTGIPAEILDRIFDPFFTTKPQGKGTGLGLATVLGIVESYEGFVLVDTKPGQGTSFKIHLPASGFSEPGPVQDAVVLPQGQGETILIVDDEPGIVRMAEAVLKRNGYQTLATTRASEAVQLFEKHNDVISAVLTDIMMPFGDGRQLITILYSQDPKLPIIAMSGIDTAEFRHEVKRRGAVAFISKPFSAEELLGTLAGVL
jgi:PAS domain S-box-containing protein